LSPGLAGIRFLTTVVLEDLLLLPRRVAALCVKLATRLHQATKATKTNRRMTKTCLSPFSPELLKMGIGNRFSFLLSGRWVIADDSANSADSADYDVVKVAKSAVTDGLPADPYNVYRSTGWQA
jgi:hypothetical protein